MLYEIRHPRQMPGESPRRWFRDDFFDLLVWCNASQAILRFQLVYDQYRTPRALTWRQDVGYRHHTVDDGETRPGKAKASPLLLPAGPFEPAGIAEAFAHASAHIDSTVAQFVRHKLMAYAAGPPPSP